MQKRMLEALNHEIAYLVTTRSYIVIPLTDPISLYPLTIFLTQPLSYPFLGSKLRGEVIMFPFKQKQQNLDIDQSYNTLVKRIRFWERETAAYRTLNIALYVGTRILVPLISTLITIFVVSTKISGSKVVFPPEIQPSYIIYGSILIIVLSSIDTIFSPGNKKKLAFLTNTKLFCIRQRLTTDYISCDENDEVKKKQILNSALQDLEEILDHYADNGWGNS